MFRKTKEARKISGAVRFELRLYCIKIRADVGIGPYEKLVDSS